MLIHYISQNVLKVIGFHQPERYIAGRIKLMNFCSKNFHGSVAKKAQNLLVTQIFRFDYF